MADAPWQQMLMADAPGTASSTPACYTSVTYIAGRGREQRVCLVCLGAMCAQLEGFAFLKIGPKATDGQP